MSSCISVRKRCFSLTSQEFFFAAALVAMLNCELCEVSHLLREQTGEQSAVYSVCSSFGMVKKT